MDVLFYGQLGERLGRAIRIELPDGGCSVAELRRIIASRHPQVADAILQPGVRACAEDAIISEDHRLSPAQTVEFFPPVSGG